MCIYSTIAIHDFDKSRFLQESPLLFHWEKNEGGRPVGGPARQQQQPLLNPEKWVGSRDKILCEPTTAAAAATQSQEFGLQATPNNG